MAGLPRLAESLARNWWILLLRGIVAVVFAWLTFRRPGITLASFVMLFGLFTLADGVLSVWHAVSRRGQHGDRGWLLFGGLAGIAVGLITFFLPGITALVLLFFIGAWAISLGILEVAAAIRLRKEIEGEWLLGLAGMASITFGAMLFLRPGAGALAVTWLIAGYAAATGLLLIALSFEVRSFGKAFYRGSTVG